MSIVAGEHGGRTLLSPRTLRVRPTSDRVRENIFNILVTGAPETLDNTCVLDLFCGVGTLGLEAISRGAKEAAFVDDSYQSLQFLRKNTEFCRAQTKIIPAKVDRALEALAKKRQRFDLIFLDPPYEHEHVTKTLQKLDTLSLLNPNALIVVQHSKREIVGENWHHLSLWDVRPYGDTVITFLRGSDV
ncbi:MAG: 16S rRNA (guanine(966)-N(2))-methyltransferase RsmD [Deltaproteobacteria bacterium]|nr:16S rRNA (guanine(966)-N(2))-methyltransferase RsmD [Deltaproteobacteria bacterium]